MIAARTRDAVSIAAAWFDMVGNYAPTFEPDGTHTTHRGSGFLQSFLRLSLTRRGGLAIMFETLQDFRMAAAVESAHNNREHMESELLAAVQFARLVWIESPENERDSARARFIDALHAFNNLVLYDLQPEVDPGCVAV